MELAVGLGPAQPGRLIMAAISAVFTIGYVANLLGENLALEEGFANGR